MASKITTLYISDTSIRLMVTRGRRITKLADTSLDMSLADVSSKVIEAEIVAKIKHLFKSNKIRTKKVIVGLNGLHCLSRPATLPQLPRAMLDEAMTREAKRVLPVPPEQLYISWQVTAAAEGKMQAFMVAIPRQIADTLLKILHQVGLKPYLMDIKPLALSRLVREATAIMVDVQSREFDIVIISDGIPQPIRTVPFPEEAPSLPDKLLVVKDELKRTVQFFNSNNPVKPIQPDVTLYISGELADGPELYESLTDDLGYRVLPLSSPLKCPRQLDPTPYLVNIGLALKELPKEAGPLRSNLNTLPVPYQPKPISVGKIIALPAAAVVIGLISMLVTTIQDAAADIDSVSSKLDNANVIIDKRQAQKKDIMEDIAAMENRLASMETTRQVFTNALDNLEREGDVIDGNLLATVNNLANGVNLRNINHSGGGLTLTGEATSEAEVLQYARNLDVSGRFSEVTVSSIRLIESDTENSPVGFTLTLKLGGTE